MEVWHCHSPLPSQEWGLWWHADVRVVNAMVRVVVESGKKAHWWVPLWHCIVWEWKTQESLWERDDMLARQVSVGSPVWDLPCCKPLELLCLVGELGSNMTTSLGSSWRNPVMSSSPRFMDMSCKLSCSLVEDSLASVSAMVTSSISSLIMTMSCIWRSSLSSDIAFCLPLSLCMCLTWRGISMLSTSLMSVAHAA